MVGCLVLGMLRVGLATDGLIGRTYLTFAYGSCILVLQNPQKTGTKKVLRRKMFGGEYALCWLLWISLLWLRFGYFRNRSRT